VLSAVALALLLSLLYESLAGYSFVKDLPSAYFQWMIGLILVCIAALIFRLPRWSLYAGIINPLIHLFSLTQIVSARCDKSSTRDDASNRQPEHSSALNP
jgi:hypothetical protein